MARGVGISISPFMSYRNCYFPNHRHEIAIVDFKIDVELSDSGFILLQGVGEFGKKEQSLIKKMECPKGYKIT